jgi:hypothetical protein
MTPLPPNGSISRELASMNSAILRALRLVFTHAPGLTILSMDHRHVTPVLFGLLPLAPVLQLARTLS